MALTITTTPALEGRTLIAASGEIDVSCASELRDAIDAALASDATMVEVDLGEVPYIDSTGIGVLVGAAHRASETGTALQVSNLQRNVRRVLDMLGITQELGADVQGA